MLMIVASLTLMKLLKKLQPRGVNAKAVGCSVGKFSSLHYDVHVPSCLIDSYLSWSGLSSVGVSGSWGRHFEGVKETLKFLNETILRILDDFNQVLMIIYLVKRKAKEVITKDQQAYFHCNPNDEAVGKSVTIQVSNFRISPDDATLLGGSETTPEKQKTTLNN